MAEHRFHTPEPVELDVRDPGRRHPGRDDRRRRVVRERHRQREARRADRGARSTGNRLVVALKGKKPFGITISIGDFSFGSDGLNVDASRIPHSSAASLATASADMKLKGRYKTARGRSPRPAMSRVTGEIEGDATVKSVSGDVRVGLVGGDLRVQTVSGDVAGRLRRRLRRVEDGLGRRALRLGPRGDGHRAERLGRHRARSRTRHEPRRRRRLRVGRSHLGGPARQRSGVRRRATARCSSCAARRSAATSASSARPDALAARPPRRSPAARRADAVDVRRLGDDHRPRHLGEGADGLERTGRPRLLRVRAREPRRAGRRPRSSTASTSGR